VQKVFVFAKEMLLLPPFEKSGIFSSHLNGRLKVGSKMYAEGGFNVL
jgi:hypothetical protein